MTVRLATTNDLLQIIDIAIRSRQLIYADTMPDSIWSDKPYDEWYNNYLATLERRSKIEKPYFCVFENDHQIISGFAIAGYIDKDYREHLPLHWVHEIFLNPNQTGKGQGKSLMHAMAQFFKQDNAKECGLCVGKTNKNAHQFYDRLGGKILKNFDENDVHGHIVPAHIYFWDDIDTLIDKSI
jgi:GNAT superfamily N-acetyltransferase